MNFKRYHVSRNLFPDNAVRYENAIGSYTKIVSYTGGAMYILPIANGATYTCKIYTPDVSISVVRLALYDKSSPSVGDDVYGLQEALNQVEPTLTITNSYNKPYLIVQISGAYVNAYGIDDVMLNSGSTALPYEPYGIKIPISSANTTTPVYLGEVETTRKIKKLVLDGTESCYQYDFQNTKGVGVLNVLDDNHTRGIGFCSHYPVSTSSELNSLWIGVNNKVLYFIGIMDVLGLSSTTDFKTYLATEYANCTPVTVWYVLATPTTGIVNEPIRKIGTHADEVSGITIPVTAGANTISVGTTLQPSEVTVNYKGWHPVTAAHERDSGAWT